MIFQDLYYGSSVTNPQEGQIIWDQESGCLSTYVNGSWIPVRWGFPFLQKEERKTKLTSILTKL